MLVFLSLFLALFSFALLPRERAQKAQSEISPERFPLSTDGGFVVVRSGEGTTCRKMTEAEAAALHPDGPQVALHALSGAIANNAQQQQGLNVNLRGTPQLEMFPAAKQAFLRAAAKWEGIIQTPITVVIDVDFGPNFFGDPYGDVNTIGQTATQPLAITGQYAALRALLISKAANARQAEVFGALPASGLPTDLGTTQNVLMGSPVWRALGVLNPVADPANETQYGAPPAIGFNSGFTFDFDSSDGIDVDKIDFEAVALHEIGHALGFNSTVGLKELAPTSQLFPSIWDLFRFRPGLLALSSITNNQRVMLTGGEQVYFVGDSSLGFSTAAADNSGGDGQQASHWKDQSQTGQYVGLMNPTVGKGLRLTVTAADLTALNYFTYAINPGAPITELLSVDDNTREEALPLNGAMVVNRFTPSRYPSTFLAVRVQLPAPSDGTSPVGQQLRLVAFVDANRTGQPPANPTLLVDRTITIPALASGRLIEVLIPSPPTINAGDLYVGVQASSPSVLVGGDRSGAPQQRSFISTNNGASFAPLLNAANAPLNLILRAEFASTFGAVLTASARAISPSAISPGSAAFTLTVQGAGFLPTSVVRWNGGDRVTTYINGGQLTAQIPAADVAAAGATRVTVFNQAGGESAALSFNITANNPAPVIARMAPDTAAAGSPSAVTVNIFGTDFTSQSVARLNGANRPTTLVSSTQLDVSIPATDRATAGTKTMSVVTPAPGGGTSNDANFSVIACSYSLSRAGHTISSTGAPTGNVLTTSNACPWTAVPSAPWITLTDPASGNGMGRYVLNYSIAATSDSAGRTGGISIGGVNVPIRQLGRATSVSAASFSASLAPSAIGEIFGAGLAKSTQVATSQPLPTNLGGTTVNVVDLSTNTTLAAPLFFASAGQVNFLVPPTAPTGILFVSVLVDGVSMADGLVLMTAVAPALFTANSSGRGLAAAVVLRVKADGTQVFEPLSRFDSTQNAFVPVPIDFGADTDRIFLLLYGSGIRGRSDLSAVIVQAGGTDAPVSYAGPQNDFVGLDQVNTELPRSLKGRGEITINLTVDGRPANAVTIMIK
jgi:uncharacterized protein (TIGR03437 family)